MMNVSRRTGYRKRRYPRKGRRNIRNIIQKVISKNTETKQVSMVMTGTFNSINTGWTEFDFCNIAQGVTGNSRLGRKIKIQSLEIKSILSQGSQELITDDAYNIVRMVVGLWGGAAGTTPLGTSATTISSPIRRNIGTRNFLIRKYYDKYIPLQVASTEKGGGDGYTPQLKQVVYYKFFKKPIYITWGDDTTTYPSARLMLAMISDSVAITNPGAVGGYALMTYEDA